MYVQTVYGADLSGVFEKAKAMSTKVSGKSASPAYSPKLVMGQGNNGATSKNTPRQYDGPSGEASDNEFRQT